jgi:hypothetical protein
VKKSSKGEAVDDELRARRIERDYLKQLQM